MGDVHTSENTTSRGKEEDIEEEENGNLVLLLILQELHEKCDNCSEGKDNLSNDKRRRNICNDG